MKTMEYLEKTLIDMIESTKAGIEKGVDFVMQEAPKLIQELLTWKFCEALIYAAANLLFIIVICCVSKYIYHRCKGGYDNFGRAVQTIFTIFFSSLVFCLGVVPNVKEMVEIKVAPRVYLIEYTSELIKSQTKCSVCGKTHKGAHN